MSAENRWKIGLAGNPNVGKSTVFNQLTGLKQHTGNWPGKTVVNARGTFSLNGGEGLLVDIPGCYSLMAHSQEEEVARDFICFEEPDGVVVVCDATCLERNLNLVLQITEICPRVMVCVNLMDEAGKKGITINFSLLEELLEVPVVPVTARSNKGLSHMVELLGKMLTEEEQERTVLRYPEYVEKCVEKLETAACGLITGSDKENGVDICSLKRKRRWLCARLLDGDESLMDSVKKYFCLSGEEEEVFSRAREECLGELEEQGITVKQLQDDMAAVFVRKAEEIAGKTVRYSGSSYAGRDRKLDWLFTSKATGFPIMFLVLLGIFWLAISGANYPSRLLSTGFTEAGEKLLHLLEHAGAPSLLSGILVQGVYQVVTWVISVMLPPMAIFFPLFTLMEDFGYLPRVAFNLDRCFKKCCACGKQALTMCMGFGCNAAGVVGCRIIDSPRERLIAILTNNFVPCNGRLPVMIAIISMFFVGGSYGIGSSFLSACLLAGMILLGIFMTLLVSRLLSKTILKGIPSSFALELPPYRRPQIGKVIVRSIFDKTLFVLGRAVLFAAPAGVLIWVLANAEVSGQSLLYYCTDFLDPFGKMLGMDGVILMAFILGLPANEIVMPIIIMTYLAQGTLVDMEDLTVLKSLLTEHGWTWITAVSTMLFSLLHWPCSTTCMTIYKETKSLRWTGAAILIPAAAGILVCFLFTQFAGLTGV